MTATLMSWFRVDETQPYPWARVPCPSCEETELARYRGLDTAAAGDPFTWFVCMACGHLTQIWHVG